MELHARKVLIHGLGRHGGGVAAARYCAERGARVTVTDLADENALAESLAQLRDVPIEQFLLGRHREEDFREASVVVVNPAVRPNNEFVQLARDNGATITSETELFLDACPAKVIGVTGTVGKSTTAAMLAAILKAAGRTAWLGGNIGTSLLCELEKIQPSDIVVLEMSSFQLHWLSDEARWPHAAIIINCTPNHLDWHGSWKNYLAAKQRLLTHLPIEGFCILNRHDAELERWLGVAGPRKLIVQLDVSSKPQRLHIGLDAACAAGAAEMLGIDDITVHAGLQAFQGLPHRQQFIGEYRQRRFIDDSKATSSAATLAAISSEPNSWILLGGADENADFVELAKQVVTGAKGAAVFGTVAGKLHTLLREHRSDFQSQKTGTLAEAFAWCVGQSQPGDTILLSPACPSTDQFRDFAERGEVFQRLVEFWRP